MDSFALFLYFVFIILFDSFSPLLVCGSNACQSGNCKDKAAVDKISFCEDYFGPKHIMSNLCLSVGSHDRPKIDGMIGMICDGLCDRDGWVGHEYTRFTRLDRLDRWIKGMMPRSFGGLLLLHIIAKTRSCVYSCSSS